MKIIAESPFRQWNKEEVLSMSEAVGAECEYYLNSKTNVMTFKANKNKWSMSLDSFVECFDDYIETNNIGRFDVTLTDFVIFAETIFKRLK